MGEQKRDEDALVQREGEGSLAVLSIRGNVSRVMGDDRPGLVRIVVVQAEGAGSITLRIPETLLKKHPALGQYGATVFVNLDVTGPETMGD
jgi:hypothetical protein